MADAVKTERRDSISEYDLEHRAIKDDAWYGVCIALDAVSENLTIKYWCSPEVQDTVLAAGDFETEAQVEELLRRFRPLSQQFQDNDCRKISVGTTVCASHETGENGDLKFYDAVVQDVYRKPHSFAGGEEECLCNFVIFWQHGCGRQTVSYVNIAGICCIAPATRIDPRILAFAEMAKKNIRSSMSISVLQSLGFEYKGKKKSCSSIETEESPQNRPLDSETSFTLRRIYKTEADSANVSSYNHCRNEEGVRCLNSGGLGRSYGQFFILIDNLEKDLTPSSIKNFIYDKTNIMAEACVSVGKFCHPFAAGAIMVDCQNKAQAIYEFLDNCNHLVVSSRGRPWVITEKASKRTFGASSWNLFQENREEIRHETSCRELEVVASGTESYKRAKQLKDLVIQFLHHESQLCKKLVLEEMKILQSW